MGYRDYPEYLKSPHWEFTRKKILERDSYACVLCSQKATEVHHINYRNWIDIVDTDLISVCEECHCKIHIAIDKGFISLNDKGSLEKTIKGLERMKSGKSLTKQENKQRSHFLLDAQFCQELDRLPPFNQQLVYGVLKRKLSSFSVLIGTSVSKKVYTKLVHAKKYKPKYIATPKQSSIPKVVDRCPKWFKDIENKMKGGPLSEKDQRSYDDYKRILDRRNNRSLHIPTAT